MDGSFFVPSKRGRQRLLALHGTKGVFSFRRGYPFLIPPYEGRGRKRLLALHETKGVFSFRREYPLLIPQRKARGVPLDPRIGSRALEELRSLRNRVPAVFLYLDDLTCSYLRCRFACDSLALRNFRLLRMLLDLQVPAKAALLRSPRLLALSVDSD